MHNHRQLFLKYIVLPKSDVFHLLIVVLYDYSLYLASCFRLFKCAIMSKRQLFPEVENCVVIGASMVLNAAFNSEMMWDILGS